MYTLWSKLAGVREDERGFTLQELLTTISLPIYKHSRA
jgi:hypothetical protein